MLFFRSYTARGVISVISCACSDYSHVSSIMLTFMGGAIYYMHENHICHRDLKPENFLFMTKEGIMKLRLS